MAHLLGLNPPKTDGSLNILSGTLRAGKMKGRSTRGHENR